MKTIVLHPRGTVYDVELDGEMILTGARDPEHAAARVMRDRGLTGPFQTMSVTGQLRMRFSSIEAAAKMMIVEDDNGLRLVKWRPGPAARLKDALKCPEGTDIATRPSDASLNAK